MTNAGSAMAIHRLLDEAFGGIEQTAEVQDLKEEMRANLVARVVELERSGLSEDAAAQRAIEEMGDIRAIVTDMEASVAGPPWLRHRVRPKPAYVVRTVVLAAAAVTALAAVVVPWFGPAIPFEWQLGAAAAIALAGGVIVADALRQETTTNYPVPLGRAAGYGVATALALVGAGCAELGLQRELALPWLVGGGLAILVSVVAFTYLGATQTNRHKPWVVRLQAAHQEVGDRFTRDPAAAARFGLYTVTIWLIALAAFAVLDLTAGWAWSWLALLAGVVAMMITLARTLFAPDTMDAKPPQR